MKVVKYVGKTWTTVWDLASHNFLKVASGDLFLASDEESRRYEKSPDFKIEKTVTLQDLLKEAVESVRKPYLRGPLLSRGKVLFFFDSEGGDYIGEKIWELQIAVHLANAGFSVHVLTDKIPDYAKEMMGTEKLTWERASTTDFFGFDYVIGTLPRTIDPASKYATKHQIPLIAITGEPISFIPGRPESKEELNKIDGQLLSADWVLVPSTKIKELMIAGGLQSQKILSISPIVNSQLLTFEPPAKIRQVVLCGRDADHKKLEETVVGLLDLQFPFQIAVITPDRESFVGKIGLGNALHPIEVFSKIPEKQKARIFAESAALIQPSIFEGFGMTILEALVLGTQVIAKPLSTYKETFGNDLIYFENFEGLAKAVRNALETDVPSALSTKYRERVKQPSMEISKIFEQKRIFSRSEKPKAFFLENSAALIGGAEITTPYTAAALAKAGFEVEVGYIGGIQNIARKRLPRFIRAINFRTSEDVKSWLREARPAILLINSGLPSEIFRFAQDLEVQPIPFFHFWTPFFSSLKDLLSSETSKVISEINIRAIRDFPFVVAVSDYVADVLQKHTGVSTVRLTPELDLPELSEKEPESARNLIVIGIMDAEPAGLQLFEKILTALPNREFTVLFWRSDEDAKERFKTAHSNLEVLEGVDDVHEYLSRAKINLYTMQWDHAFGRFFAEGLYHGTPVIAPALGNLPLMVKRGGILLHSTDAKEWVEAIEKCFSDDEFYEKLQQGARSDFLEIPKPDYLAFATKLLSLIERVPKVSFITQNFPGGLRLFKNFSRILGDGAGFNTPGENLIFCAGHRHYPNIDKKKAFCFWASSLLQTSLDGEIKDLVEAIEMVKSGELGGLLSSSDSVIEFAKQNNCPKAYYLPVPAFPDFKINVKERKEKEQTHVTLFVSTSPRKNILTQALAIQRVGGLTVHTSEFVAGLLPKEFCKDLNIVRHPFITDEEIFNLFASVGCGLQVTTGESFNQAAFEHLALGTPCLISRACKFWRSLPSDFAYMIVDDIEDVSEIEEKLRLALKETRYSEIQDWAVTFAKMWNLGVQTAFSKAFS
jgi:glycosyltransferase involved in cell wall biosynthesis